MHMRHQLNDADIESLKEKRRAAAERVRRNLQDLEQAERDFANASRELLEATQRLARAGREA